ncbi:hypothetical protein [Neptunicella sp. SCSIO 80796]|uniref:hypothetical protein n=1 Tax=Neptunicella plasticusilytica TaxID=3117012 RepID=UPI003A4D55C0
MNRYILLSVSVLTIPVGAEQQYRDPTRPPVLDHNMDLAVSENNSNGFPPIKVSAIFSSAEGQYAIINGRTLSVGQGWANIELIAIGEDSVTLSANDVVKTFVIHSHSTKKDVANVF